MPKNSILIDVFRGEHITLMLRTQQEMTTEEGDLASGYMIVEGILVEMDDDFLYLTSDLNAGINEAVRRTDVIRILATDGFADDRFNIPEPPKDQWN